MFLQLNFQNPESELRIRLVARNLPFHKYKRLAEWLGCYLDHTQIQTAGLIPQLTSLIAFSNTSDLMKQYHRFLTIEWALSHPEQECLYQLISAN